MTEPLKLIMGHWWKRVICWVRGHRWFDLNVMTRTPILDMLGIKDETKICLRCGKVKR